ncbi:transglutaminase domain-containing protein [Patescibacteria group bacterium]
MLQKPYLKDSKKISNDSNSLGDLVVGIQIYINNHYGNSEKTYSPQSIIESRFTPPEVAFNIPMTSCGSMVNIATEMLRHLGYEVKKIHGSVPESSDHAWIKVRNKETQEWVPFDITKKDCDVTEEHKEIAECAEWEEISDLIAKAHLDILEN